MQWLPGLTQFPSCLILASFSHLQCETPILEVTQSLPNTLSKGRTSGTGEMAQHVGALPLFLRLGFVSQRPVHGPSPLLVTQLWGVWHPLLTTEDTRLMCTTPKHTHRNENLSESF